MARMPKKYDPNKHEPNDSFDPLPPGWYQARVTKTEIKKSQANPKNQYLNLTWQIDKPKAHKGRLVWSILNLWNQNVTAREIAENELASICEAMGISKAFEDTKVLEGRPIMIKVAVREATDKYDASNDVKGYKPIEKGESKKKKKKKGGKRPW